MFSRVTVAAAALAPLASAFSITVTSTCPYTVYGWNVVDSYGSGSPTFTLESGASWTGPFESKSGGGGPSMKLQKVDSLFVNAQQSQVEYDMAGNTLFYDLSNINGFPFSGDNVMMQTSNPNCPTVYCPASEAVCSQAYNQPNDLRTLACDGGANIQVILCQGAGGTTSSSSSSSSSSTSSTSSSSSSSQESVAPPSAPAPVASSAPAPQAAAPQPTTLSTQQAPPAAPTTIPDNGSFLEEGPDGEVEVVVATTVVAVTSTIVVPGPTAAAENKRDAHLKAHLHRGHSRAMGRHAL